MVKTAAAKRLAEEKDISMWEAERQMDADVYLSECQWWVPFRLHHKFCCTGCSSMQWPWDREHDHAIHCSRRKPSSVQDLEVEPSTVELVYANSMREEIAEIYCNVYSCDGCQGKHPVMWRWKSISTRKSWIVSWNTSSISRILHYWRNQDTPPPPPDVTPRPTIEPRTVLTVTSSKIQCEVPVKRP